LDQFHTSFSPKTMQRVPHSEQLHVPEPQTAEHCRSAQLSMQQILTTSHCCATIDQGQSIRLLANVIDHQGAINSKGHSATDKVC
jgi:hypothetical protein